MRGDPDGDRALAEDCRGLRDVQADHGAQGTASACSRGSVATSATARAVSRRSKTAAGVSSRPAAPRAPPGRRGRTGRRARVRRWSRARCRTTVETQPRKPSTSPVDRAEVADHLEPRLRDDVLGLTATERRGVAEHERVRAVERHGARLVAGPGAREAAAKASSAPAAVVASPSSCPCAVRRRFTRLLRRRASRPSAPGLPGTLCRAGLRPERRRPRGAEQERREVQHGADHEQGRVADEQGEVLQAAADASRRAGWHRTRPSRRRSRRSVWRRRCWPQMIGRNASATAPTRRAANGSCEQPKPARRHAPGATRRGSAYITRDGGVGNRRVSRRRPAPPTSTPAKTSALTSQVVPNSSAKVATFLVSSSRNAAPMKNRSAYGRIGRDGPPRIRTRDQRDQQDPEQRPEVDGRDATPSVVQERPVVGRPGR